MADFTYTSRRGNTYTRKNDVDFDAIHAAEMKKADQQTAEFATGATAAKDQYIADLSGAADQSLKAARDAAGVATKQTAQSYGAEFDANAASELAAQRHLKEQMANYGLGKSGVNATNQTALQIRRANADAATRARKQAAIDNIRQQLALYEAQVADGLAEKKAAASYETAQKITAQGVANRNNAGTVAMNRYNIDLGQQDALNDFVWDVEANEDANEAAVQKALVEAATADADRELKRELGYLDYNAALLKNNSSGDDGVYYPAEYKSVMGRVQKYMEEVGGNAGTMKAYDEMYKMVRDGGTELDEATLRNMCIDVGLSFDLLAFCIATRQLPSAADLTDFAILK